MEKKLSEFPGLNFKPKSNRDSCEKIVRDFFSLNDENWELYNYLKKGPKKVEEISDYLGKTRSTAQRELQKLVRCGICEKKSRNLKKGGYFYEYTARSFHEILVDVEVCIDKNYNILKDIIRTRARELSQEED